ncbi:DUF3363 domain-containing protein, partial [Mesorhizobium sp. M2E.F.Ca.ET.154.01.1.1]|uniref:DUF3363 domain-containing protein n=1 Tax=Mesorhizobium sp. M2E.F.Ca.ET.154.01.1.1 TaxID=2500521 RepID=UPI0010920E57
ANLLDTLRCRELEMIGDKLAADSGRPFNRTSSGDYAAGVYGQRLCLASGRFAMIDDGVGFYLVPWQPVLDKRIGQHITGLARDSGGIEWGFGRKRGLGL